jgi:protein-S-isoprenylcysteine O-methyltransferase Ste14
MSTVVLALRAAPLLAYLVAMLLNRGSLGRARGRRLGRVPLLANFAAIGLWAAFLAAFAGRAGGPGAMSWALPGCAVGLAGVALARWSRTALGSAWSLVPAAAGDLATSGPYRLVRHPVYLGLLLLTTGEAIAFRSCPALLVVGAAILPSFVWRARTEERLLAAEFGERYVRYREQTPMLLPHPRGP